MSPFPTFCLPPAACIRLAGSVLPLDPQMLYDLKRWMRWCLKSQTCRSNSEEPSRISAFHPGCFTSLGGSSMRIQALGLKLPHHLSAPTLQAFRTGHSILTSLGFGEVFFFFGPYGWIPEQAADDCETLEPSAGPDFSHLQNQNQKQTPEKIWPMSRLETLVWVCPLGLGGQGACLVVLGTQGGRNWLQGARHSL